LSLKQTVYFMAIVGGIAGLASWLAQAWLSDYFQFSQENQWILVLIYAVFMGAFIGGLTVGFADRWTADRVMARWVLVGVLLGVLAGLLTGLVYIPIQTSIMQDGGGGLKNLFGRLLAWLFAGAFIGFVVGLRWFGVNRLRAVHAMIGGMVGGGAGALVFTVAGADEIFQALAFVLTGVGITLGVTLAPVLLRDGVLQFISSGDPRAQNKYASPRQEWVLQQGDHYVVGSQGASATMTIYSRDVQIYIPDALVSARHALLYERNKRFFIQLHPDNVGLRGQAMAPLLVGNLNVTGPHELRDGDNILVGQTLLLYSTRKKRVETPAPAVPMGARR
jgi:hypothetical protein